MWSRKRRFSDEPARTDGGRRPAAEWTTEDYWGSAADDRAAAAEPDDPGRDEPELVDPPDGMRAARSGTSDDAFWDYLRGGALR